mgnify:CR=1 FL=1
MKKPRFGAVFSSLSILFRQLHQLRVLGYDVAVAAAAMGQQTTGAVLDAVFQIPEIAAAFAAQRIQRAVAEQAVEVLRMVRLMAGKKLARPVLGEGVGALLRLLAVNIVHFTPPLSQRRPRPR